MRQALQSQRFTLRLDPDLVDSMAYLLQQYPYRYQSHSDIIRQALQEYLALRVDTPGAQAASVKLPRRCRARLQRLVENGYGSADQLMASAIRHYSQFLLEEEALFQDRFEAVDAATPTAPKLPENLVQE